MVVLVVIAIISLFIWTMLADPSYWESVEGDVADPSLTYASTDTPFQFGKT